MPGFFEDLIRFFQEPPDEDWEYRDKGLLKRGIESLGGLSPDYDYKHIRGADPLYDLVGQARRSAMDSVPWAEPGQEPDYYTSVDPLQQYSGPNIIDERARKYREAYPNVRLGSPDSSGRINVDKLESYDGPGIIDERARLYREAYPDIRLSDAPQESQFQADPNSPWAPSIQKFVAEFPQEALAPSLRRGEQSGLDGTGVPPMESGQTMHDRAQAAIAARVAQEEQAAKDAAAAKEYMLKMKAAKEQDDWVRSVGYEPDQTFSDPEKGILVEDINAEKLAKIRAQAAVKGKRGSLRGGVPTEEQYASGLTPGGGGLTTAEMTPEIEQRLAERDAWAAQQPMRDAAWDIDVARQRRDTSGQDSAAGRLQSMQQQALAQSKQDAINSLLANVTDKTGKIDPDTYQKLGMLGQYVPSSMVGKGKEQTIAEFDSLIARGSETISQLAPQAVFDPSGETARRVAAERKGVQLLTQLKQMVASGQMTGEEASATFQQAMMMDKYVQGWLAEKMMPQPGQLQQGE